MQFKLNIGNQWIKKTALVFGVAAITLAALLFTAATEDKNLRFDGKFHIKLMAKNAQGVFEIADELKFDNGFNMKVNGLGRTSSVTFDLQWNGSSMKGRRVNLKVSGPGQATFDPATGSLRISALYVGDIDGQPTSLPVDLTTESFTCTGSTASGKRVQMSGDAGMVELASCSRVKDAKVLAKNASGSTAPSEIFAIARVSGKISPK
ncbi:MAG: hypothetical protein AAB401_04415 [Acidobacteriota bacterium]